MQIRGRDIVLSIVLSAVAAVPLLSQTVEPRPAFEVATIRPNQFRTFSSFEWPPLRFVAINQTLKSLLQFAYSVGPLRMLTDDRITGGPSWIDLDRFDIQAKPERPAKKEELQRMLQTLLEERFQLRLRHESREMPVYDLVVGKSGPKLKLSERQTGDPGGYGWSDGTLTGKAIPISAIIGILEGQVGRAIRDKTGLKGLFDIELQLSGQLDGELSSLPSDTRGPSLFTAIQELGLRLESNKAPLETIVIESVEKPSEN